MASARSRALKVASQIPVLASLSRSVLLGGYGPWNMAGARIYCIAIDGWPPLLSEITSPSFLEELWN